mmetsp:Transcript_17085/g.44884  ORF Transcript_17085/g.44884 Transcript_17085/m.44884 type:complete len:483 (+) Transcript_17085:515-1963(+)
MTLALTRDTSSCTSRPSRLDVIASTDPAVSALSTMGNVRSSLMPSPPRFAMNLSKPEDDAARSLASRAWFASSFRASASLRAVGSSGTTDKASPARGARSAPVVHPTSLTGVDGPASSRELPNSSCNARHLPHAAPAVKTSPTRSVPLSTNVVAQTPRPFSTPASMTVPVAGRSGLAFKSSRSAWSSTFSRSSSRPVFSLADTRATRVSPPALSGTRSYDMSSPSTRWASAPSTSILLTATTTGAPASLAQASESTVCSLQPSSAATTNTTISVTLAPLSRISVKAAWPGVSINVTARSLTGTTYAPMPCVMPPASPLTTSASRSASSSDVLPWSTWPIIVTTGDLGWRLSGSSSSMAMPDDRANAGPLSSTSSSSSSSSTSSAEAAHSLPKPSTTSRAVAPSTFCVTAANTPILSIRCLTTSAPDFSSNSAKAPTEIGSSGTTTGFTASFCFASRSSRLRFLFNEPRAPRNWTGLLFPDRL